MTYVIKYLSFLILFIGSATWSSRALAQDGGAAVDARRVFRTICIDEKDALSPTVKTALRTLLASVDAVTVRLDQDKCRASDEVVLTIGDTPLATMIIPDKAVSALAPEGFIHRFTERDGRPVIAVRSKAPPHPGTRADISLAFGVFSVLAHGGFSFLHPLEPTIPTQFSIAPATFDTAQSPHLGVRGIHLHTMHPIELADLLNGWGTDGPNDEAGFDRMLDEWHRFLTWMIANKLNRVEWVLLQSERWRDFALSCERQFRLNRLVDIAHDYGIEVGIDAPIAMRQQNAFRLIETHGRLEDELQQIRRRLDWLMQAGFDFFASENGTTEFTHPDPERMLAWMNAVARHLDGRYRHKKVYMKVHVSSGQTTDRFTDPGSGGPLNINFLTYYADKRLAVMPHTVSYYGLDDPAPTYGNQSFADIARYMQQERSRREIIWYPETAYWCSFDIDVPLFLPLYAERRLSDLRRLAKDARAGRVDIDGQVVFSSGWEWGYWLNDVIAARAAWDPRLDIASDDGAFEALLQEVFEHFGSVARPLTRLILETAVKERAWLILGANRNEARFAPELTGQAYLQGEDTLDDLARMASGLPLITLTTTQPSRTKLLYGQPDKPRTLEKVDALLAEMSSGFTRLADALDRLTPPEATSEKKILEELRRASRITAKRATQIFALFRFALAEQLDKSGIEAAYYAALSRKTMAEAAHLVRDAEGAYRVDATRIAGWRQNPTAYRFGYLWSVRNLYYWHRDHQRLVDKQRNVCFANVIDPFEVSLGFSMASPVFAPLRRITDFVFGRGTLDRCLVVSERWRH